jgi:hypothetical protein
MGEAVKFVCLKLTSEQEAALAPLVRSASAERRGVILIATASPARDPDREDYWRLQVARVSASTGQKILRLVTAEIAVAKDALKHG